MLTRDGHVRVLEKYLQIDKDSNWFQTLGSVGKDLPKQNAKSLGHMPVKYRKFTHLKCPSEAD